MFESIVIRKSLENSFVDIGLIAECLLFYNKIQLVADPHMLQIVVRHIGLDTLEALIQNGNIILSFSPFMTGTRTNGQGTFHEYFDYCTFAKVSSRKSGYPDFEALFFESLEKGSGKKGKSRRVGNRLFADTQIIDPERSIPVEKGLPEIARCDLENKLFLSSAIQKSIQYLSPNYNLPSHWEFNVLRHSEGFNVQTNIDFDELNRLKDTAYFPDPKSRLSKAYLLDTILKANEDLFYSAHLNSELITKPITSSIIELKLNIILKQNHPNSDTEKLFQKVILPDAKKIREAINMGERHFHEIVPLVEKSEKFKEWLTQKDDIESAIREYHKLLAEKTWIEKLPSKIVRFSFFTGAGILADALMAGGLGTATAVALNIGDNFLIEKIGRGWKPAQYIKEVSKFTQAI